MKSRRRIKFLDHGLYISALEDVMKLILCRCFLLVFINRICKQVWFGIWFGNEISVGEELALHADMCDLC